MLPSNLAPANIRSETICTEFTRKLQISSRAELVLYAGSAATKLPAKARRWSVKQRGERQYVIELEVRSGESWKIGLV